MGRLRLEKTGTISTKLYNSWRGMKERCYNSNNKAFKYYGGKGIEVCTSWQPYKGFKEWAILNGYEEGLTIDRLDSNKNYEPSNCVWIPHVDNVIKSNSTRYLERYNNAKEYWKSNKCTGTYLAELFGVSFSIGCRWIRKWKKEQL